MTTTQSSPQLLLDFLYLLREVGSPVSLREWSVTVPANEDWSVLIHTILQYRSRNTNQERAAL